MNEAAHHFRKFLEALGLDLEADPELADTPRRVTALLAHHLASTDPPPLPEALPTEHRGTIVIREVPFVSFCAHHLVPFMGSANLAYIPSGKIMGFGAFGRVVDQWARRPQLQERLGEDIARTLVDALDPEALLLVLHARQLCMELGCEGHGGRTLTFHGRGAWSGLDEHLVASNLGLLPPPGCAGAS